MVIKSTCYFSNNYGWMEQLRSWRIGDYAIFDFVSSIYGMHLLAKFGFIDEKYMNIAMVGAIPLGIAVHYFMGITTPLNTQLGL